MNEVGETWNVSVMRFNTLNEWDFIVGLYNHVWHIVMQKVSSWMKENTTSILLSSSWMLGGSEREMWRWLSFNISDKWAVDNVDVDCSIELQLLLSKLELNLRQLLVQTRRQMNTQVQCKSKQLIWRFIIIYILNSHPKRMPKVS